MYKAMSPTTTSSSQWRSTDCIERSAIQENSFRHNMGTAWIICLLLSFLCYFSSIPFCNVFGRYYDELFILFTILKLISEPHSLLLENQGSERGSKGHN